MIEIQDLLYQLRLSEQASTQLFEKRLGISLTRYQILLFLQESNSPENIQILKLRIKTVKNFSFFYYLFVICKYNNFLK